MSHDIDTIGASDTIIFIEKKTRPHGYMSAIRIRFSFFFFFWKNVLVD